MAAFKNIQVWSLSNAFDEILENFGNNGTSLANPDAIETIFPQLINDIGLDGDN